VAAARVGAVAALVRSITPYSLYTPHTGGMSYQADVAKIPTAGITIEDAELLARIQGRGHEPVVTLYMEAHTGEPVTAHNVIAEVKGARYPDEVIVLGGHSDSWDVGTGAMDDGGGLFSAWDSLRIISDAVKEGAVPRPDRTIRVVLWANEELGARGAIQYRETHLNELSKHIVAMESDSGNFWPTGFGLSDARNASASAPLLTVVKEVSSYLASFGAGNVTGDGRDVDNGYLYPDVPCMSLESTGSTPVNGDPLTSLYFYYHHTNADTVTALNPQGLRASVAAFAAMTYYIANLPPVA
jgi:carboxypeptidase Q